MTSFFVESSLLPLFFLFGALTLTTSSTALLRLGKYKSKELLKSPGGPLFFFRPILKKLFSKHEWENLYFSISLSKHIYELAYSASAFFYLLSTLPSLQRVLTTAPTSDDWPPLFFASGLIIIVSLILDFGFRLLASLWSRPLLKIAAPFASLYL